MEKLQSVVLVASNDLANFERVRTHLNKKALKFGLEPIKVLSQRTEFYKRVIRYVGPEGDKLESKLVPMRGDEAEENPVLLDRIELEYPIIRLGNWQVAGKIEATEGGNLVFSVGGSPDDEKQLMQHSMQALHCEHCAAKRKRKASYLLRDPEGAYKVVGSSCLKDFTGIDPGAALFLADMYGLYNMAVDLDDWDGPKTAGPLGTMAYLMAVSFLTEQFGFVSATKAREDGLMPTYDSACGLLMSSSAKDADTAEIQLRKLYESKHAAMHERAKQIVAWFADKKASDSYTHNVKLLLAQPAIQREPRQMAFVASAVASFWRENHSLREAKRPSEHVGQTGEKLKCKLKVIRVLASPSRFAFNSLDYLVLMEDELGNRLRWKTSSPPREIVDGESQWFQIGCKVKEHSDYKGVKQTAVTHVKLVAETATA